MRIKRTLAPNCIDRLALMSYLLDSLSNWKLYYERKIICKGTQ